MVIILTIRSRVTAVSESDKHPGPGEYPVKECVVKALCQKAPVFVECDQILRDFKA